jgi:hypothetical protein
MPRLHLSIFAWTGPGLDSSPVRHENAIGATLGGGRVLAGLGQRELAKDGLDASTTNRIEQTGAGTARSTLWPELSPAIKASFPLHRRCRFRCKKRFEPCASRARVDKKIRRMNPRRGLGALQVFSDSPSPSPCRINSVRAPSYDPRARIESRFLFGTASPLSRSS